LRTEIPHLLAIEMPPPTPSLLCVLMLAHMQVLDYDIGSIFGGVVMVKLGSILLQLFRNHSPDVQNMVNPKD
jgi:hypothetical protein